MLDKIIELLSLGHLGIFREAGFQNGKYAVGLAFLSSSSWIFSSNLSLQGSVNPKVKISTCNVSSRRRISVICGVASDD